MENGIKKTWLTLYIVEINYWKVFKHNDACQWPVLQFKWILRRKKIHTEKLIDLKNGFKDESIKKGIFLCLKASKLFIWNGIQNSLNTQWIFFIQSIFAHEFTTFFQINRLFFIHLFNRFISLERKYERIERT